MLIKQKQKIIQVESNVFVYTLCRLWNRGNHICVNSNLFSVKKASVSKFTLRNSPSINENNISQAAGFGVKSIDQFFVAIKLKNNYYFCDSNLKKLDWRATPITVLKTSKIFWCVS